MPYFAPYTFQEYPKWLRRDGHPDVLVGDADAEAAQIAAWGADAPNRHAPVNLLVGDAAGEPAEETDVPKRRGGWPKGKKRGNHVAVN